MPEIKHFPKMCVAYVSNEGPYGEATKRGFDKLFVWLGANNVKPRGASLGIFYDDPAKVAPEKLRSESCVPVAPDVSGSGEVQTKKIGDVDVATIIYQGEQSIERAYNAVYDWLRAQGYRDSGAPIETYLSQPGEELRAEIAVPIVKMELLSTPKRVAAKKPIKRPARKATQKVAAKRSARKAKKVAKKK